MASRNLDLVRAFLSAMERGVQGDSLARYFTSDVTQHEFPNRLVPGGKTHDLASILSAAARGQAAVRDQRYLVKHVIEQGDHMALELEWSAVTRLALGALAEGSTIKAHYAIFFTLRDGKIAGMRNYDCFEPF